MADNLNLIKEKVDEKIVNTRGLGAIKALEHNDILTDVLNKCGKYIGLFYKAKLTNTAIAVGQMSWENNAMDASDFQIVVAELDESGIDIGLFLNSAVGTSYLKIKDQSGRNALYQFVQIAKEGATYRINLKSIQSNPSYSYTAIEEHMCAIELYLNISNIIPFGQLIIHKAQANTNNSVLEGGDSVTGQLNSGIFLQHGVYDGTGNPLDLTSYGDSAEYYELT